MGKGTRHRSQRSLVIDDGTPFDCRAADLHIAQVSLDSGTPVVYGVITTDTIEQAIERAGTKSGNKGYDAGLAALEEADLVARLET